MLDSSNIALFSSEMTTLSLFIMKEWEVSDPLVSIEHCFIETEINAGINNIGRTGNVGDINDGDCNDDSLNLTAVP